MSIFERDKLTLVANVEQVRDSVGECATLWSGHQNSATGLTAEGKTPKNLVEEMVPLLDSREIVWATSIHIFREIDCAGLFSNANKVRVVALYIQHRDGVPEEDRRRLYQHARLSLAEQDAVNALVHFGTRINRVSLWLGVKWIADIDCLISYPLIRI